MEFISSDSNIWLDFNAINRLDAPFLIKDIYTFLISRDTLEDELITPIDLGEKLTSYGLIKTELTNEEFLLSIQLKEKYTSLSVYDTFALAIAKLRGIILLSGDGPLRKAAKREKVEVHGTLWVVDQLWAKRRLQGEEYKTLLAQLENHCGKEVRLPLDEILKRIKELY